MSKTWILDEARPADRQWEEFYRNRWQHDKRRAQHARRQLHRRLLAGNLRQGRHRHLGDAGARLPDARAGLPPYEPRGCQRGISYSWYLYSPLRVKYPVHARRRCSICGSEARARHEDPVEAWESLVEDPEARARWQQARGKGGFRRADWDTVLELIAAATIHTIKKHGPDRIAGFSPIPAMSMVSYAVGRALPAAASAACRCRSTTGTATCRPRRPRSGASRPTCTRSADWYNAKLLAVDGLQPEHDAHAGLPLRRRGAAQRLEDVGLLARLQPGRRSTPTSGSPSTPARTAPGGWRSTTSSSRSSITSGRCPYFLDYAKQYTDAPFLVELEPTATAYRARPAAAREPARRATTTSRTATGSS